MKFLSVFFAVILLFGSLTNFISASEPDWQGLVGNSTNDLAGAPSQNDSCPFIGNDPNCGKYIIGLMALVMFLVFCVSNNVPSEASIPIGDILILFLALWGWLPMLFLWVAAAISAIPVFLMLYRLIGG